MAKLARAFLVITVSVIIATWNLSLAQREQPGQGERDRQDRTEPREGREREDEPLSKEKAREELNRAFRKAAELRNQGKLAEAIVLFEKAAGLGSQAFGLDDLNTADILNTLGATCSRAGRLSEAEKAYRESLRIREKRLGKTDLRVSSSLNNLGLTLTKSGQYVQAEAILRRALEIKESHLPKNHADFGPVLTNLASLYQDLGRFIDAESLYNKSLDVQEAKFGKDHPQFANTLNSIATLYRSMGRIGEAEKSARRSLEIWENKLGKDSLECTYALNTLGLILIDLGRYGEAENHFRRSLSIREATQGKASSIVASALANLGLVYQAMDRFGDAEDCYRNALKIDERVLGEDHPDLIPVLNNLAGLYDDVGRSAEAETVFRRSLRIAETSLGKDHPQVATLLHNLSIHYQGLGKLRKAKETCQQCLRIGEASLGREHVQVGIYWLNLGTVHQQIRMLEDAEANYLLGLRIIENRLGKDHPKVALALGNLAEIYWHQGQLDKALALVQRSEHFFETRKREHPDGMARALLRLAGLHHALGHPDKALEAYTKHLELKQAALRSIFTFSSETAINSYVQNMNGMVPGSLTLAMNERGSGPATTAAITWTLRLKGIALDTMCQYREIEHRLAPDDALTQSVSKFRNLKRLLANTALSPPVGLSADEVKQQSAKWRQESDELEAELHRAFAARKGAQERDPVPAAVQQKLAPQSVVVEFVRAPVRDFKNLRWSDDHYYAFVLRAGDSPPQLFDLGQAKLIDEAVQSVRRGFADFQDKLKDCESDEEVLALEKTQEKQFLKVSAALYKRLLAPLENTIGDAKLLYFAPDGALNQIPFEALVDESGKYLVECRPCVYLSSGRDLLRPKGRLSKGTVVFAAPDYKMDAADRMAQATKLLGKKEVLALRSMPSKEVRSVGWKALPGAAAEAKDIHKILNEGSYGPVKSFVGPDALEEVLKALPAPRVLHLATHGFFIDREATTPEDVENADDAAGAGAARSRLKKVDNPLLRSGIILAGANTVGSQDASARVDDGWVTAEEIAFLNLRGTELVVLSACQTGLGDIKSGEGVFGLRRAFLYAGARTLVTSLFEVPDKETRDLMNQFYKGLGSGEGKLAALHAAQREMIRQRRQVNGAAHPFYWASFILAGDPE